MTDNANGSVWLLYKDNDENSFISYFSNKQICAICYLVVESPWLIVLRSSCIV